MAYRLWDRRQNSIETGGNIGGELIQCYPLGETACELLPVSSLTRVYHPPVARATTRGSCCHLGCSGAACWRWDIIRYGNSLRKWPRYGGEKIGLGASARPGLARLGSARLGSAWARPGPARLGSARLGPESPVSLARSSPGAQKSRQNHLVVLIFS